MTAFTSGNTSTTCFSIIPDLSGNLVFATGGANLTALTLAQDQTAAFGGSMRETVTISGTGLGANLNFDAITQGIYYSTAAATANTTINFRGNSSTTLNNMMSTNQSLTLVVLATNTTAYYINGYQIDGSAVVPKWQGGVAPSSGDANSTDIYTFTVIKTANATFTVFASQVKFA